MRSKNKDIPIQKPTNEDNSKNLNGLPNLSDEAFTKAVMVECSDGMLYLVDPMDNVIGQELRINGTSSADQIKLLGELIEKEDNLLVVGAHIGTLAIPLSKKCKTLTAIEANPDTYSLLIKNISLNQASNCYPYQFAAQDVPGEITFLLNRQNSGGSKREPIVAMDMYYYDHPKKVKVNGYRLDDQFPSETFDMIIMDIEGSEYFALKGMPNLLKRTKGLLIEFLPHHLKYVSGVSIEQFYDPLSAFDCMLVPSRNILINQEEIFATLKHMFENDITDEGLLFMKD